MPDCPIESITILPGKNRQGKEENFTEIVICPGDIISIVGPTGSGKSALINDIEVFARNDTATKRTVLVNGQEPPEHFIRDPACKPIALITQNTKCLADLTVNEFLGMHVRARRIADPDIIGRTIGLANEFTGEKIAGPMRMTSLSGGQTRSLFIADAITICSTPIILLDEVESGGICKEKVIPLLKHHRKAVLFVTHDPLLALLGDRRIVMRNGAVEKILVPDGIEKGIIEQVAMMDRLLSSYRERIRSGDLLIGEECPG
jgi:ABC-type lipoprotein export system ATPase subunit